MIAPEYAIILSIKTFQKQSELFSSYSSLGAAPSYHLKLVLTNEYVESTDSSVGGHAGLLTLGSTEYSFWCDVMHQNLVMKNTNWYRWRGPYCSTVPSLPETSDEWQKFV